jgi:hypothetical protein
MTGERNIFWTLIMSHTYFLKILAPPRREKIVFLFIDMYLRISFKYCIIKKFYIYVQTESSFDIESLVEDCFSDLPSVATSPDVDELIQQDIVPIFPTPELG